MKKSLNKRKCVYCVIVVCLILFEIAISIIHKNQNVQNSILNFGEKLIRRGLDREIWLERFWGNWIIYVGINTAIVILLILWFISLIQTENINLYTVFDRIISNLTLRDAFISSSIFMLATHAYAYFNGTYMHDFSTIHGSMYNTSLASDRWLITYLFPIMTGYVASPWLSGVLSVVFITVSVYLLVAIFDYKSKLSIWLIAGICSTDISIIMHNSYTGTGFFGPMALMFICAGIYFAINQPFQDNKKNYLYATILIIFSMATYGSYLSLFPAIVIINVFRYILAYKRKSKDVLIFSFRMIAVFLYSVVVYYIIYRLLVKIFSIQTAVTSSYMNKVGLSSLGNYSKVYEYIPAAISMIIRNYLGLLIGYPKSVNCLILLITIFSCVVIFIYICNRIGSMSDKKWNMLICIIAAVIYPLILNMIVFMTAGQMPHFLMIFPYVVPYFAVVKLLESNVFSGVISDEKHLKYNIISQGTIVIICAYIGTMMIFANAFFTHMKNMYDVTLSIGTRILDRIESMDGFNEEDEVIIIGFINSSDYYDESRSAGVKILDARSVSVMQGHTANGFSYNGLESVILRESLGSNLNYKQYYTLAECIENCVTDEEKNIIESMDIFPSKSGIARINNKIYIRFEDYEGNRVNE